MRNYISVIESESTVIKIVPDVLFITYHYFVDKRTNAIIRWIHNLKRYESLLFTNTVKVFHLYTIKKIYIQIELTV